MNTNEELLYFAQQRMNDYSAKFGEAEPKQSDLEQYGCYGCSNGCSMSCKTTCSGGLNARRVYR